MDEVKMDDGFDLPPRALRHADLSKREWDYELRRVIKESEGIPRWLDFYYHMKGEFLNTHPDEYEKEYWSRNISELQDLKLIGEKLLEHEQEGLRTAEDFHENLKPHKKSLTDHMVKMDLIEAALQRYESRCKYKKLLRMFKNA
jgi:hypothetical protein